MIETLHVRASHPGLHDITTALQAVVDNCACAQGLLTAVVQHTSASLTVQENADPSARHDLERWLNRLVAENDALYTHTAEGPDDMPAHIKAALTTTSLSLPIVEGRLALGTWQGIYLWEHRTATPARRIVVHVLAD